MKEKDISNIADDYAKRTNAQSCIIFGNELKGLMYWVQDMKRMSINPEDQDIASADIQLAIEKLISARTCLTTWRHQARQQIQEN
jgi:N-acetylglucosamine kinase-like BadF-type ATPase